MCVGYGGNKTFYDKLYTQKLNPQRCDLKKGPINYTWPQMNQFLFFEQSPSQQAEVLFGC